MDLMRGTVIVLAAAGVCLTGCGLSIPADPDGTLQRVTDGELRVGVSPNPPWTVLPPSEGEPPTGREVDLVHQVAEELDAEVQWIVGGEEALMSSLEQDELDLVIGGLTEKSPWSTHAALTVPHTVGPGPEGDPVGRVFAVPLGENAFMVSIEQVLVERGGRGG